MGSASEWDATNYQRLSEPMFRWGRDVLAGLNLAGDELVVDAGCGTGRVTRLLAQALPHGRVIAVDASEQMVAEATHRLRDLDGRVQVRQADLLELHLDRPADLIVSTATFHWIPDHPRLFARLWANLRPGGRLVAQCGGAGNITRVLAAARAVGRTAPYADHLAGMREGVEFPDPPTTVHRLAAAGFEDVHADLVHRPTDVGGVDEGAAYLATVVLRLHMRRLPRPLREAYARAVATALLRPDGRVQLDYVRLNLSGRRPAE